MKKALPIMGITAAVVITAFVIRVQLQTVPGYDYINQRHTELVNIQSGVSGMMDELKIDAIPNPASVATNDMSLFPDASSGYVLYRDGPTPFVHTQTTQWYYTCESDGTVRQWWDQNMAEESRPFDEIEQ